MEPAFTVPGYTGRGTPIPPGFYNIAYYNLYLREGGTPLEGFPLHTPGTSLTATYGTFGDGRPRATSFGGEPPNHDGPCVTDPPAAEQPAPETGSVALATRVPTESGSTTREPRRAEPRDAAPAPAAAASKQGAGPDRVPPSYIATAATARALAQLRADLEALLDDLIRSA